MSISSGLKVECGDAFPFGVGVVSAVTALADFDASTKEHRVQSRDKESGLPVWTVDVMDFDPEARERTFKVKIVSPVQPVPPEEIPGAPVRPVYLEGLTVTAYVKEGGRRPKVAYSLRASGLSPAKRRSSSP